jgi:aerobic carbon-monoxide dehydrogenase large subunit
MKTTWFGQSFKRKEDPAFLKGEGRYVDDIQMSGMLHAAFARSAHAHAKIISIDKSLALAVPGVHAVLTYADLPDVVKAQTLPLLVPHPSIKVTKLPYTLVKDEACYVGEPIACVIADNRYIAEDAAQLIDIEYEPLAVANDCLQALEESSAKAHLGMTSNVAAYFDVKSGDTDKAFASPKHVFKEKLFQHRGGPFFMECRGAVAQYERSGDTYTLHVSSQGSHRIKRCMLELFDIGDSQLRVMAPDVGGGFGPKGSFYPEYANISIASKMLGRPVKWIEDRRENFLTTHQERDQYWDVEIAVDDDAKILGVRGRLVHDNGAYVPWGIVVPWISATTVPGPYVIPAFKLEVYSMYTNKIQVTSVRGAGRPQAVVAMERLMDRVANELHLDPAEVRRRNFIQPEQMPYNVGIIFRDGRPVTYDSGDYPACQQAALDQADYAGFATRQQAARERGRYLGIGMANGVEATGLGPYEGATVKISTTGKITVYTSAVPQGQSHKTTLAQIAADQLNANPTDITVVTGDTANLGLGVGTFAARTAVNAGSSVHMAAIEVAKKIKAYAAVILSKNPEDLEIENDVVFDKANPSISCKLKEVAVKSVGMPGFAMPNGMQPGLEHTSYFMPERSTYSNATIVAEVEVDVGTGMVDIHRMCIAHDCGKVINPMVVNGQIIGGAAHGIGNALLEEMVFDENAQPVSTNFGEYLMPLSTNMPVIDLVHLETPSPLNPLGVKGAGESGTIPAIAAIIGAVENALKPFDVKISQAPISPQKIIELLGPHLASITE